MPANVARIATQGATGRRRPSHAMAGTPQATAGASSGASTVTKALPQAMGSIQASRQAILVAGHSEVAAEHD